MPGFIDVHVHGVDGVDVLDGRGAVSQVAQRLRTALDELGSVSEFDYVVVNDDLERCIGEVKGIVDAEARRTPRAATLQQDVEQIRSRIGRVLRDEYANAAT